jgi:subtilisin family serine protease
MTTAEDNNRPPIGWSGGAVPYAYVPGRALARGEDAASHLDRIAKRKHRRRALGGREEAPEAEWTVVEGVEDSLPAIALAQADGFDVQPDHVFFAHGDDDCSCGPHPFWTYDALAADPYRANPYRANPYRANPYRANPYRANPYRSNPYRSNPYDAILQTSSAIPAAGREFPPRDLDGPGTHPRIAVLDTGLAKGKQLPGLLKSGNASKRISGDRDRPDSKLVVDAGVTWAKDNWLDPVAGHGTFIAGIVEQLAPGCTIGVRHAISGLGDAVESEVIAAILALASLPADERPDILSLSFGGTAQGPAPALRSAIRKARLAGIVIVASAGNDGVCEPQYPAAYNGVIAVGALGPDGPTPWTNYGTWVDACARGADIVSSFFADFDGPEPRVNTVDPDRFEGWATWSGTSFAAPVVVAAIAREMVLGDCTAKQAADRVVYSPAALRIRCLGTVVAA